MLLITSSNVNSDIQNSFTDGFTVTNNSAVKSSLTIPPQLRGLNVLLHYHRLRNVLESGRSNNNNPR